MLNFTMSRDGQKRASVLIKFRFDAEEMVGIIARELWGEYTDWGKAAKRWPSKSKIEAKVRKFISLHGIENFHSESLPDKEWERAEAWAREAIRFHFPELSV